MKKKHEVVEGQTEAAAFKHINSQGKTLGIIHYAEYVVSSPRM